jgi:hypothetical protein
MTPGVPFGVSGVLLFVSDEKRLAESLLGVLNDVLIVALDVMRVTIMLGFI